MTAIEMYTDSFVPLTGAAAEARFAAALPARQKLSPLAGCWRTEVGELNQLIHLWPHDDRAAMERVRAQTGDWPGGLEGMLVKRERLVLTPAPFSPPLVPRALGGVYEFRIYTYPTDMMPLVFENWEEILAPRLPYSPLAGAWYAEQGATTEWVHVWPYESAGARERIRAETTKDGVWPPSVVDRRLNREPKAKSLRMRNLLAVPTAFSPLR